MNALLSSKLIAGRLSTRLSRTSRVHAVEINAKMQIRLIEVTRAIMTTDSSHFLFFFVPGIPLSRKHNVPTANYYRVYKESSCYLQMTVFFSPPIYLFGKVLITINQPNLLETRRMLFGQLDNMATQPYSGNDKTADRHDVDYCSKKFLARLRCLVLNGPI